MNDFLFVSVSEVDEVLEEYFLSGLKQNKDHKIRYINNSRIMIPLVEGAVKLT